MTSQELRDQACAELEACERELARRIEAGDIDDDERSIVEELIAGAKRDYAVGLAREEARTLRSVAEPGHVAALSQASGFVPAAYVVHETIRFVEQERIELESKAERRHLNALAQMLELARSVRAEGEVSQ